MTDSGDEPRGAFPTFRAAPGALAHGVARLWRKTWRYVAAVIALLILAHLALNLYAGRVLERELTRLRAEGAPLTVAEAAPPPVTDARNAWVLYEKAWQPLENPEGYDVILRLLPGRPPRRAGAPEPTVAQVESVLAPLEPRFRLLEEASLRPACRFPVDWSAGMDVRLPYLPSLGIAVDFLAAKALVDAQRGRAGEALEDLATAVRMSNHLSAEPMLISQLVRGRCLTVVFAVLPQVLASAPPTEAQSRAFYDLLAHVELGASWVRAMQGERAAGLQRFDRIRRAHSAAAAGARVAPGLAAWGAQQWVDGLWPVLRAIRAPILKLDEAYYVRHMGRVVSLADEPYREAHGEMEALSQEVEADRPWYAGLSGIMVPVFSQATVARDSRMAELGLMRAALALRAYRIERGEYPDSLDELRAAGGWAIPGDPFSGKPFIYRRKGEGYLIYSIGGDLVDDGGLDQEAAIRKQRRGRAGRPAPGLGTRIGFGMPTGDIPLRMKR